MTAPAWKVEPLEGGAPSGCLNCPGRPATLEEGAVLAVGFGFVTVSKDGETVWSGDDEIRTIDEFEVMAAADPDHDWRVEFMAPLYEAEYQRQGLGYWVCVRKGMGFA